MKQLLAKPGRSLEQVFEELLLESSRSVEEFFMETEGPEEYLRILRKVKSFSNKTRNPDVVWNELQRSMFPVEPLLHFLEGSMTFEKLGKSEVDTFDSDESIPFSRNTIFTPLLKGDTVTMYIAQSETGLVLAMVCSRALFVGTFSQCIKKAPTIMIGERKYSLYTEVVKRLPEVLEAARLACVAKRKQLTERMELTYLSN